MNSNAGDTFEDVLILVVEDDRPIQNFISTTLKANGYALSTADSGTDGVAMAYSRVPDA